MAGAGERGRTRRRRRGCEAQRAQQQAKCVAEGHKGAVRAYLRNFWGQRAERSLKTFSKRDKTREEATFPQRRGSHTSHRPPADNALSRRVLAPRLVFRVLK